MKKYRCPNCGDRSISFFDRFILGTPYRGTYYANSLHTNRHICGYCTNCKCLFTIHRRNPFVYGLLLVILIIPFLSLVFLTYLSQCYSEVNTPDMRYGVSAIIYIFAFAFLVLWIRNILFSGLIPFDTDKNEAIIPVPNGVFTLTQINRRIRNMDIFDIRFSQTVEDKKFNDTFPDALIPVMFDIKSGRAKADQHIRVTILKKDLVPVELLHENSRFVVIDKGKEIASGFIYHVVANT